MKDNKHLLHPNQFEHLRQIAVDELRALRFMLRNEWRWVLCSIVGLLILLYVFNPLPPNRIKLASGQAHSSLEVWSERYQQYFRDAGVEIELVSSNGAQENIELINQKQVQAALTQGGMPVKRDDVVSMGSIGYMPLWLFYRGNALEEDPNEFLSKAKISINVPGSGTHSLVEKLLERHELTIDGHQNFLELSSSEGVKELLAGRIDGVALVAGMESGNVQKIIDDPSINIYDFQMAHAYANHLDYLEVVDLPRGAIDLKPIKPSKKVQMPATTTVLLIDDNLHPAIQYLFLKASTDLNSKFKPFFRRSGGFPAYIDHTVPESEIAERYYTHGLFPLDRFLPFWAASFLDRAWFYLLASFAIIYPLLRISPKYRFVNFQLSLDRAYTELKKIEKNLGHAKTDSEIQVQAEALDVLLHAAKTLWVPTGGKESYYQLMQNIGIVQSEIQIMQTASAAQMPNTTI